MSTRLSLVVFTITGSLIFITGPVRAEQDAAIYLTADDTALDNTGRNVRDKDDANLNPEDHKENEGDINITATIRQAVVKDESLSINAKNVKIITRNGVVTLRGPVATESESMKLQQIAKETPGVVQVDNQLENIAP